MVITKGMDGWLKSKPRQPWERGRCSLRLWVPGAVKCGSWRSFNRWARCASSELQNSYWPLALRFSSNKIRFRSISNPCLLHLVSLPVAPGSPNQKQRSGKGSPPKTTSTPTHRPSRSLAQLPLGCGNRGKWARVNLYLFTFLNFDNCCVLLIQI